ncbi:phenylalanine/histidine ammonia-lyase [Kribbella capetownensis]|uniref:Phenylalanine/histidine ammonia-lyase n=1 Tax=Kribbella capetownensis TaxID=1572659 RepID=A0A4R0JD59_9ACTN|nr:aromatic amino acid lyase [Kribbella capetownensis]TCC43830.1 phenylalanine/histidine ammonia-lyase [Kribbella capetownensis]
MLINQPSDLDPASPEPITIAQPLLDRLAAIRADLLAALASGGAVYGVNTGMGNMSKRRLTEDEQRVHQRNLLLGRAVGGPPWLPPDEARAVLIGRLRTFLTGDAGVSVELIQQLVAMINSGQVPDIPAEGAGSAGEIIPLAHAFSSVEVGPKEGISLLAGVPGATGRAALQVKRAHRLADHLTAVGAGAIAVIGANRAPYDPAVGRGDDVLAGQLARIRELAGPEPEPRALQAPVSFRVAGHVVAHVRRSIGQLDEAVDRAFAGVTDSPAYLDGEFIGTAGFHGIDLTAYSDHLTAALAHAAEVSAARLHRLLDPAVTGLQAQLAHEPGPQAGLVAVHKRAVATTHLLHRLTLPSAISTAETSNGQEDVQTFSWEAVGTLAEAIRLTREVTACELLAVHQAFALSKRPIPVGLRDFHQAVADVVPPIEADRPFGQDLTRLLVSVL